jgi:DNA invertase Pin-like site-specific DNA recombinase
VPKVARNTTFGTFGGSISDARGFSTAKKDQYRRLDALRAAWIAPELTYLDKKSGATTDQPGLNAVLAYARDGDVIVVHTLDRLGRTVRDTLNLTGTRWSCVATL